MAAALATLADERRWRPLVSIGVEGIDPDRARDEALTEALARKLGRPPGAEGSIGKLALSNVARQAAKVHSLMAGSGGLLAGVDPAAPLDGVLAALGR
jgi:hypothetical protein